jgi:hypothetical protein
LSISVASWLDSIVSVCVADEDELENAPAMAATTTPITTTPTIQLVAFATDPILRLL